MDIDINSVSDLEALLKDIGEDVGEVVEDEVVPTIKKVVSEHVKSDVYGVYTPKRYKRTGKLANVENIVHTKKSDGTITIQSSRQDRYDKGRDVAEVVIKGHKGSKQGGYNYVTKGATYLKPRPFIDNAQKDLENNKQHEQALVQGLKNLGYKME